MSAQAQTRPDVVRYPRFATLERTIRQQHAALISRYGAHHIGISKKIRRNEKLPQTCVTFYVEDKRDVEPERAIPPQLPIHYDDGRETRLVATDVCAIASAPVGLATRIRGGHVVVAQDGERGTVGMVFTDGSADYLLTNAHVVTDPSRPPGPVLVPGPLGDVGGIVTAIDDLTAFSISSDAALVRMEPGTVDPGRFRGQDLAFAGTGDIATNDPRKFYFVSSDFTHTATWLARVDTGAPISIDGHSKEYFSFHKFKVTSGGLAHGDSGAVVFCESHGGLVAVGLLFGGELGDRHAWVFPIRRCLTRLGVNL